MRQSSYTPEQEVAWYRKLTEGRCLFIKQGKACCSSGRAAKQNILKGGFTVAQYSYSFNADPSDTLPSPSSTFYVPNGNVSIVISNAQSDVSNWTLGLVLYNPDTGHGTSSHAVTPSNPSTVFTDMLAANYRLLMRSVSEWVRGTVTIYTS